LWVPVGAVVVVGVVVIGLLVWLSWRSYSDNENRLLGLKAKEAAALLTASVPSVQTPLAVAAQQAQTSGGNPRQFDSFMASYVGSSHQFVSASLWRLTDLAGGPVAHVGSISDLGSQPGQAAAAFSQASRPGALNLTGVLRSPDLRLGYFYRSSGATPFVVYAEVPLPADRRARIAQNSAFSDIHYALYVGRSPTSSGLLATDLQHLPVAGRHQTAVVPFGSGAFTLVVSAQGSLGGGLSQWLPWIIAVLGAVGTVVAAAIGERLVRRRRQAERLAAALDRSVAETQALYAQQRTIAETLQEALLPGSLAALDGMDSACRYVPGTRGMEIGGDWYDLVSLDDHRAFFVVGDVSGRGIEAAAVMARLRHAALAYVYQGDLPDVVLTKLRGVVDFGESDHFATVACGMIDTPGHEIRLANAGHLPMVLVGSPGGRSPNSRLVSGKVGLPIGIAGRTKYAITTVKVPAGATLLAFTDGLIERRGEPIDVSLKRLADAATVYHDQPLDSFLTTLVDELTRDGIDDDAAILGVRWQS
jgi:serine phosphatase RsbU (regulator of sigma subunit)